MYNKEASVPDDKRWQINRRTEPKRS